MSISSNPSFLSSSVEKFKFKFPAIFSERLARVQSALAVYVTPLVLACWRWLTEQAARLWTAGLKAFWPYRLQVAKAAGGIGLIAAGLLAIRYIWQRIAFAISGPSPT